MDAVIEHKPEVYDPQAKQEQEPQQLTCIGCGAKVDDVQQHAQQCPY